MKVIPWTVGLLDCWTVTSPPSRQSPSPYPSYSGSHVVQGWGPAVLPCPVLGVTCLVTWVYEPTVTLGASKQYPILRIRVHGRFPLKFKIDKWKCRLGNRDEFERRNLSDKIHKIWYVEKVLHIKIKCIKPPIVAPVSGQPCLSRKNTESRCLSDDDSRLHSL
jgi:hypothetical protein